jgi:cytochrome c-type biogenesis protein CcsB
MKRSLLLLPLLLTLPSPLVAGPDLDPLRTIAIQDRGRVKPFDTFAREMARRIGGPRPFGAESIKGLDPVEWIVSMLAAPERWRQEPVIRVAHAGLREAAGLPAAKDHYSFDELRQHEGFLKAAEAVHQKFQQEREPKLDPIEQEISTLQDNLATFGAILNGDAVRIIPNPPDPNAAWFSIADLDKIDVPSVQLVKSLLVSLVVAYRDGDRATVASAASALNKRLAELSGPLAEQEPALYPSASKLRVEVQYNALKPFRLAWLLYLLGFLLLLSSFPLAARGVRWTAMGLVVAGFLVHAYGMALRIVIAGRPPVSNMYESVIWVAWGAMLFALIFEAIYKSRYFAAAASAVAVIALILADNVPILDGSIAPLVPVLRSNLWLTVHVLTITLGYAAFMLGMGLGHLNLGLYFFAPRREALFKRLSLFLYRSVQVGTVLLATGTMLGGVWASYSWGRFWGWDPKETWALIALLGYLAILHGRMVGWFREFGMAVGSIIGFLLVLMAWYGVNFVLGTGLHSYGFGSGGYAYVGGFVAFEFLVIGLAMARRRAEMRRAAAPAAELQPVS